MNKYDWSNVPKEVKWIATDDVEGELISWGYPVKPRKMNNIWLCNKQRCEPILIGIDLFKGNWQESLEERPND